MRRWFQLWFLQSGVYRCDQCGKSRTTLRSIVRHIKRAHTLRDYNPSGRS